MAICLGCGLCFDEEDSLGVCLKESTVCDPNILECDGDGLSVTPRVAVFRVNRPVENVDVENLGAQIAAKEAPIPFSEIQEDTTPGMFTLQDDGCVVVNCEGIYAIKVKYSSGGHTGAVRQTGGFIRWSFNGQGVFGIDTNDLSGTIQLGSGNEGPEYEASTPGILLPAGTRICPEGRIYTNTVDGAILANGFMHITYLGQPIQEAP